MYDKHLYDWMELEYAQLQEGMTVAGQVCPLCKGGREAAGTMSVSRHNRQLLWLCHRASCQFRRGKKYNGRVEKAEEQSREVVAPKVSALTDDDYSLLKENYGLSRKSINKAGVGTTPPHFVGDSARWYLPIRSMNGEWHGFTIKAIDKSVTPKTINKTTMPSTMAWYPSASKVLVVVEDQLSAIRAADKVSSVAILGTHLNDERIEAIMAFDPSAIYLCLDLDAWDKALKYSIKFRAATKGRMIPFKIKKDIKNMTEEEFETVSKQWA